MATYNTAKAKASLSALLDRVEKGEDVVIARRGKAIARLTPIAPVTPAKVDRAGLIGCLKGVGWVADDAFDPEPNEVWFPKDDILLK